MIAGKKPEGMDPRAKKDFVADFDYEFDEKHKTVAVTEQGVAKAEKFLGIDHLYRAENGHLVNHLIQALKAESLYKRDVDYAVIDGEVKIIDEFTGRILEGRRWSEGLHQAVEAKEGVRVQEENQTLATITLQNYFRMYDKLAGMTGTALTEATEFMKIYELGVVQIPTNRPMVRADQNDQVYKTKDGKWSAVEREIAERHEQRPAGPRRHDLRRGLRAARRAPAPARHPAHGAQRQARARRARGRDRRRGRAARRGHDRDEHGRPRRRHQARRQRRAPDAARARQARPRARRPRLRASGSPRSCRRSRRTVEEDREKVIEAGGLFICGTERHESRRIDNQLRGRSGRQGDPGESRFFLCAEDDLVRLFAGDRIYRILDRLGTTDEEGNEEPIEAGMLSKQIEKAQRKVEEQNFLIRKRVLEYDDVMNEQRRDRLRVPRRDPRGPRHGRAAAREEIAQVIEPHGRRVHRLGDFVEDWDLDGLFDRAAATSSRPTSSSEDGSTPSTLDRDELDRRARPTTALDALRPRARQELGDELMRALERYLLLQIIDQRWREHLYDMDYLREGIHLRGFAQIEPLVAYKNEAFTLFRDLMNTIWSDFARMIFHVEVEVEGDERRRRGPVRRRRTSRRQLDARRPASPTRAARAPRSPARCAAAAAGAGVGLRRGLRRGGRAAAGRRAAPRRRGRADRAQRPVLVRVGQEVQEVPRRLSAR